jgi:mannose-1-phosphate guanylyltransferase
VGEKPILEIIINKLRDSGITNIVIFVGYLAGIIEAYFTKGERFGVSIDYFVESEPLGTAGYLALIENLEDELVVTNGGYWPTSISTSWHSTMTPTAER